MQDQRRWHEGTGSVASVTVSAHIGKLQAESLALTRAAQAVKRWAQTAPAGSWGRKRLDDLAKDITFDAETSCRLLCEAMAERQEA
jgi:hypothetical protein